GRRTTPPAACCRWTKSRESRRHAVALEKPDDLDTHRPQELGFPLVQRNAVHGLPHGTHHRFPLSGLEEVDRIECLSCVLEQPFQLVLRGRLGYPARLLE